MMREHPEAYSSEGQRPAERHDAPRSDRGAGADDPARAARRGRGRVRHRVLERRQPDPGALGAPRRRAGRARRARRRLRRAPAHAAGREPGALRRRRRAGRGAGAAARRAWSPATPPASRSARSRSPSMPACSGSAPAWRWPRPCCSPTSRACRRRTRRPASAWRAAASGSRRAPTAACGCSRRRRLRSRSCCSPARACCSPRSSPCRRRAPATTCGRCWRSTSRRQRRASAIAKAIDFYQEATRRIGELPGVEGVAVGSFVPWRDAGSLGPGFQFTVEGYTPADGEENPRARMRMVAPRFFAVLGVPIARRPRLHRRRPRAAASRCRSSARASRSGCSRTATR